MIDNQFEVAKAIENPVRFTDQVIGNYKRGANPMVPPNVAAAEEQRRNMIRNAVQGMMARQGQQQQQQQPQTVIEFEKQKLAQQEAMQKRLIDMLTSQGVGSLPTKPDMFSRGGGVVAFNGQDGNFVAGEGTEAKALTDEQLKYIASTAKKPVSGIFNLIRRIVQDPSLEREEAEEKAQKEKQREKAVSGSDYMYEPSPANKKEERSTQGPRAGAGAGAGGGRGAGSGQGQASPSGGGGISSLDAITKRAKEIHEGLAKDTEGETLLRQAIKAEMKRSGEFKDLDEKQLDAVAQKRIDEMKAESAPLFAQMKSNIEKRRGEQVGMTPEERRRMFIGNLGKRGTGWRNVFGESLSEDAKQAAQDRSLNRTRQDLLDKEEMELARAEMLEGRGQRKEADEARKLAMQAHRDRENLRRQQAQTMIGGAEKLATAERKKAEAAAKPELEELQARERRMVEEMRERRNDARAAQQGMPSVQKLYQFYTGLGYNHDAALKMAREESTKFGAENLDAKLQAQLAKDPAYKAYTQQLSILSYSPDKNKAAIDKIKAEMDKLEAKYRRTDSGAAPAASSGPWNNTYQ